MEPVRPDSSTYGPNLSADDVGEFRQGTAASRWALARYLVGRAIIESVGTSLYVVAVALLAIAAALYWGLGWGAVAILVVVFAAVVLLVRFAVVGLLRRLTAVDRFGSTEGRLRGLVADTSGDVRRELRRVGLPSRVITLPLLAVRLVGRRRADTLTRMRAVDIDRVVPAARLDELHLLLRSALGSSGSGSSGSGSSGSGSSAAGRTARR